MKKSDVIDKLRELKVAYIQQGISKNPAALPEHVAEFLGYATLLYDFYGDAIEKYEHKVSAVTEEEDTRRIKLNAEPAEDEKGKKVLITQSEVDKRIAIRLGNLVANKKSLEQYVKGATLHINGCQSLLKNWNDEAKGNR